MIYRLTVLFRRAKYIFQTEGLIPLLRQGFAFLIGYFFQYGTYYLYEYAVKERNETDFMPRIQNFTFKVFATNQQADKLVADDLDFRSYVINARQRLDKGAIAFCVFVDRELAYIGWVAMSEEAKKSLTQLPIQVDFSNNEAYTGSIVTNPKYRRMGLTEYVYFKKLQFLKERGRVAVRAVVATNNIAVQQLYARLGSKLYAEARYLKLLWWRLWKEKPLTPASSHDQSEKLSLNISS